MADTTSASLGDLTVVVDTEEDQLLAEAVLEPVNGEAPAQTLQERLNAALAQVWTELAARASELDFLALLAEVYGVSSEASETLASRLAAGDTLGLRYEIESGAEMGFAAGAYASVGDDGVATIYINGDWLSGVTDEQLRMVLLEEIGHRFDAELNPGVDTAGDEGELFAHLFSGVQLSEEELAAIGVENDGAILTIDGAEVVVEAAAPILQSVAVESSGNRIKLTFDTNLDQVNLPAIARFTLTAGGRTIAVSRVVSGGTNGTARRDLYLELNDLIFSGETVVLTYTDPSPANEASGVIQEASSPFLDCASFTKRTTDATNPLVNASTQDGTPPALISSGGLVTNAAGTTVTLTFTEALDQTVSRIPAAARFTVTAMGGVLGSRTIVVQSVAAGSGSGANTKLVLTLEEPVYQGEQLFLSYSDLNPSLNDASGVIQDLAGNDASSFSAQAVNNVSTQVFNAPPTSAQKTLDVLEDTPRLLLSSDFPFSDPESAPLAAVEITTLPAAAQGQLQYRPGNNTSWTAVTPGQQISAADLDGGRLRFVPPADASGPALANFTFRVSDGSKWNLAAAPFIINVTAVNDAPSANASGGSSASPKEFREGVGND